MEDSVGCTPEALTKPCHMTIYNLARYHYEYNTYGF